MGTEISREDQVETKVVHFFRRNLSKMIITSIVIVSILLGAQVNGGKRGKHSNKTIVPEPGPIYKGDFAGEMEFKYIVGIARPDAYPFASGIILNELWILTNRHVVIKVNAAQGSSYFNITDKGPLRVWPKYFNDVRRTYHHRLPLYDPQKLFCFDVPTDVTPQRSTDSDLALIKLQTPINLGNQNPHGIQKIDFHVGDMFKNFQGGFDVRIAGWGSLDPDRPREYTYELRKAKMPNEKRENDRNLDPNIYPAYRPFKQMPLRLEKNGCDGDSGGPAVLTTVGTGEENLIGVITWISSPWCKDITFVTNMGHPPYKQWIDRVMREEPDEYLCSRLYGTEYNRQRRSGG